MGENYSYTQMEPFYKNKSLIDLPNEIWKDIPGFEGSYQASSLGKIKSLDRIIPHPRLKCQFVQGRILSQKVGKNRNLITGEPTIDLGVTLTVEAITHYYNTRRLVYKTFTDPALDYQKTGLYVINMDGDGYNNKVENLCRVTKREKQQRVIARNRMYPFFKTADRSHWKKNYSKRKPVAQYDLEGNFIKQYHSIKEASKQNSVEDKAIIQVAKGLYKQWNGFVWRYAD